MRRSREKTWTIPREFQGRTKHPMFVSIFYTLKPGCGDHPLPLFHLFYLLCFYWWITLIWFDHKPSLSVSEIRTSSSSVSPLSYLSFLLVSGILHFVFFFLKASLVSLMSNCSYHPLTLMDTTWHKWLCALYTIITLHILLRQLCIHMPYGTYGYINQILIWAKLT